jgi:NCAIR mutase (PurE)-related protein
MNLQDILQEVDNGSLSVEDAMELINAGAEKNLGFARVDTDRPRRRGMPEAIYCPGKTKHQIIEIMIALKQGGQDVLATRATPEQYEAVGEAIPEAIYDSTASIITLDAGPRPEPVGLVAVLCGGTSDIPVAEEAALTAERIGARVERIYDVGVAGIHRVVRHLRLIRGANVVVVAAGMEGALPSVVGGLIDKPIIAIPTSIGYGTSLKGFTPLLAMLNSCTPGISVVNIDNGFGAGVSAGMINRCIADAGANAKSEDQPDSSVSPKSSTQKILD